MYSICLFIYLFIYLFIFYLITTFIITIIVSSIIIIIIVTALKPCAVRAVTCDLLGLFRFCLRSLACFEMCRSQSFGFHRLRTMTVTNVCPFAKTEGSQWGSWIQRFWGRHLKL